MKIKRDRLKKVMDKLEDRKRMMATGNLEMNVELSRIIESLEAVKTGLTPYSYSMVDQVRKACRQGNGHQYEREDYVLIATLFLSEADRRELTDPEAIRLRGLIEAKKKEYGFDQLEYGDEVNDLPDDQEWPPLYDAPPDLKTLEDASEKRYFQIIEEVMKDHDEVEMASAFHDDPAEFIKEISHDILTSLKTKWSKEDAKEEGIYRP